jgi:copper chaperone CopZ
MRLIAILLCCGFLTASCSSRNSGQSGKEETESLGLAEENLGHLHLEVKGMTCEGCENAIVASIKKLDGIQEATASHTQEEAMIVFDTTKTTVDEITHAIVEAGYSVEGESGQPHH